jgi:choline dehydrogenase-like flavoprotein
MFAPLAITSELARDVRRKAIPGLPALFNLAAPLLRRVLRRYFEKAIVLAALIEDLPYHRNRIYLPPGSENGTFSNLMMDYTLSRRDEDRVVDMRRRMKEMLKPYRMQLLPMAENNELIAHVCGTCRFGNDPRESVLDRDNRAHGIENLYVVDASFFPTSTGTNPALTIAANALRVADKLLKARESLTVARDARIS